MTTYSYTKAAATTITVTTSGHYDLELDGAQGGAAGAFSGGEGAAVGGDIYLQAGAKLELVLGGEGDTGAYGAGGGGGTFVIELSGGAEVDELLAVAGGGGGAAAAASFAGGGGGAGIATKATGGPGGGNYSGQGGVNGGPGAGGFQGGGGGGYSGGYGAYTQASDGASPGSPGEVSSETQFKGGAPSGASAGAGGFGGGGGGGYFGGGGGGGYGGGGGGGRSGGSGGGGGGSYLGAEFKPGTTTGTNAAHIGAGEVVLTLIDTDAPCYCGGTLILTAKGEIAVEDLTIGDFVVTVLGERKPIKWIGRRAVSTRFADPLRVRPIRIKAGAFAENAPSRDLRLSPCHAVLIGEILVQAGALVNGSSIVRETDLPEVFTYYHVETDDHELILAENTPAETFIDNTDRLAFDNWAEHEALYPEGKEMEELAYPRAKAHRQVPMHVRAMLTARATAIREPEAEVA